MKKDPISLSQIGLYNPQRVNDDVAERLFIVRTNLFESLIERLTREAFTSIPQHYLIIAQRGMGKSTLLKRIEVELRKDAYKGDFIPLIFPEEQYNLKNLAEFWLNTLDALADTLEVEKQKELVRRLDRQIDQFAKRKDLEDLAKDAFQLLQDTAKELKRRPVLLIDNMSLIFDRLDKSNQHTLRAWLMDNSAPIMIGASAVAIKEISEYSAPFYDAFKLHHLRKLSFGELKKILLNLATVTDSREVLSTIHHQTARLKTIHQLTGGNPRTATMLFKLIVKGFAKEINDDLEALLDEITPLYKARFEELSDQMQIIVDAIALHWDPISLAKLRETTRLENNQLSPQLKRLVEVGWLETLDAYQAKGNAYQISERFFNIWFLMRRSSRRQKRELYCLSRFLELLYGDQLEGLAKQRIALQSKNLDHITYDLAIAQAIKDQTTRQALEEKSYQALRELAKDNPRIRERFYIPDEDKKELSLEEREEQLLKKLKEEPEHIESLLDLARVYYFNDKYKESENLYLRVIKLESSNAKAWNGLGNVYSQYEEKHKKAESAYLKAIELDDKNKSICLNLGDLYKDNLGNYENAEQMYLKTIELDSKDIYAYNELGNLYQEHFERYTDAEKMYLKAIKLDNNEQVCYYNLGNLYKNNLERYSESEQMYLKAIELDKNYVHPYNGLGNLYQNHLEQYEEAEKKYLKAIELDKNYVHPYNGLGNLYQNHLGRYEEAEKMYLKAIELDDKYTLAYNNLGDLYQDKLKRYEDAKKVYIKLLELDNTESTYWNDLGRLYHYHLEQYEDAKKMYKKAIELDDKDASVYNKMGNLYYNHLNRYTDSEKFYLKAIDLDETEPIYYNNLGNLYQYHLERYKESEQMYLKAINLDNKHTVAHNNLGDLYQDHLERYKDAEKMYLKTLDLEKDKAIYWNDLGRLYHYHLERYTEAEKMYLKAVNLENNEPVCYNNLGRLYKNHLERYKDAEKMFLKAIELDKTKAYYYSYLGDLYFENLEQHEKAITAYKKAIELDKENGYLYNSIGNIYQDYLHEYDKAEQAYLKVISRDKKDTCEEHNLIFLYRDKMHNTEKATALMDEVVFEEKVADSYWLNKALFELYKRNEGVASEYLQKALAVIENDFSSNTQDDWWRFGSVVDKLGYHNWLLEVFKTTGHDVILSPYYVVIKALGEKDTEGYLNSKAVEIREPARLILKKFKQFAPR